MFLPFLRLHWPPWQGWTTPLTSHAQSLPTSCKNSSMVKHSLREVGSASRGIYHGYLNLPVGLGSWVCSRSQALCVLPVLAWLGRNMMPEGTSQILSINLLLPCPGDAHGPDSCNQAGGLCRMGTCVSGEYLAQFCFEPVILCCKNPSPATTES